MNRSAPLIVKWYTIYGIGNTREDLTFVESWIITGTNAGSGSNSMKTAHERQQETQRKGESAKQKL